MAKNREKNRLISVRLRMLCIDAQKFLTEALITSKDPWGAWTIISNFFMSSDARSLSIVRDTIHYFSIFDFFPLRKTHQFMLLNSPISSGSSYLFHSNSIIKFNIVDKGLC